MSDEKTETKPQQSQDGSQENPLGFVPESSQFAPDTNHPTGGQPVRGNLSIFDERFALFMTQFGATCEANHVPLALAIVLDPTLPERPLIFYRGQLYEIALLTRQVLDQFREQVLATLI